MRSSGSNTSGFRCLYFNPLACAGIVGATEDSYPIWITSTWSSNILIQRLVFNLRIRQRSREILWYAYALVYSLLRKKNIYFHAPNTLRSRNHFFCIRKSISEYSFNPTGAGTIFGFWIQRYFKPLLGCNYCWIPICICIRIFS